MTDDRLDWHLDNWAIWMHAKAIHLWYPSRASGRMGSSGSSDFDEMVESADARCAAAIDALIDDLPQAQHLAVYHVKLFSVFRLPRLDINACFEAAKASLQKGLTLRGIF